MVDGLIASAVAGNAFAAKLAGRMSDETNTRFTDWVDHLVVSERAELPGELTSLGYVRQPTHYAVGATVYAHEGGMFPRVVVVSGAGPEVREVAINVESIA